MRRGVIDVCQFVWPWLEEHTPQEKQALAASLTADEARINSLDFKRGTAIAIEEARRLSDSEAQRRRGTDQKAATYLPLVAALVPLILTVVTAFWEKKTGGAPAWINMLLLALAVSYTAAAGLWAFEELKVSVSHEPGLDDFEKAWSGSTPGEALARRVLLHTRRNREGVNWKVSCIIMAHAFLLRAFLTFSLLLLVNIAWYLVGLAIGAWWPAPGARLTTPKQTVAVIAKVNRLAAELRSKEAWTVLERDCRARTGHAALVLMADALTPLATIPAVLQPAPGETGAARTIHVGCSGKALGLMRVWFIPARLRGVQPSVGLPTPLAAPATSVIVDVRRNWPPTNTQTDPSELPKVLIQQLSLQRDPRGRPTALVITAIESAAILDK